MEQRPEGQIWGQRVWCGELNELQAYFGRDSNKSGVGGVAELGRKLDPNYKWKLF